MWLSWLSSSRRAGRLLPQLGINTSLNHVWNSSRSIYPEIIVEIAICYLLVSHECIIWLIMLVNQIVYHIVYHIHPMFLLHTTKVTYFSMISNTWLWGTEHPVSWHIILEWSVREALLVDYHSWQHCSPSWDGHVSCHMINCHNLKHWLYISITY